MTGVTDDPNDPRIKRGQADNAPVPQNEVYLVLSEEERGKGFVRPYRTTYRHVGRPAPRNPLRDLDADELERYGKYGYIKFEAYPESELPQTGRFWTQADFDATKGCDGVTTMGRALSETYARQPDFYGATYCVGCGMHRPVGAEGEFVWEGTLVRVGT